MIVVVAQQSIEMDSLFRAELKPARYPHFGPVPDYLHIVLDRGEMVKFNVPVLVWYDKGLVDAK